jgi:hypothetical protein
MRRVLPIHPGTAASAVAPALAVALLVLAVRAAAATPGVLILHSNQRPTPAQVVIDDTLRSVVPERFNAPVQLFSEYLDDEWASLEIYGAAETEFLAEKYRRRDIRVIAQGLPATKVDASQKLYDDAKKRGWTIISMKDDWRRVFAFE